ncbi:hypothetical protein ACHAQJ_003207 [Trichoderma viride]
MWKITNVLFLLLVFLIFLIEQVVIRVFKFVTVFKDINSFFGRAPFVVFMIGSTNHIERLDPAVVKRPSRLDRKYQFKLPTEDERIAYCHYWREKFSESDAVDFPDEMCPIIAKLTENIVLRI